MDGADISTMAEHQNNPVQNKTSINVSDDIHLDSGYASSASISYNQSGIIHSPYTSSSIGHFSKGSTDLETIIEHYEQIGPPSTIETPTTHSIRKLNEFHIQTPNNAKSLLETTPKKSIYRYNDIRGNRSITPKKNRNNCSPYKFKSCEKSRRGQSRLSFDKSNFEMDTENIENSFSANVADQSIGLSPIVKQRDLILSATATINSHSGLKRIALQRHPSGIESSTPVSRSFKRSNTLTETKSYLSDKMNPTINTLSSLSSTTRLMRKVQSFSPRKYTVLKEIATNFQNFEKHTGEEYFNEIDLDMTNPINDEQYNPAKKMLKFSTDQFNDLLNVIPKPKTEIKQIPHTYVPSHKLTEDKCKPKLIRQSNFSESVNQSSLMESDKIEEKIINESPVSNEEVKFTLTMKQSIKPRKLKRCLTDVIIRNNTVPNSLKRKSLKRSACSDLSCITRTKRKLFNVNRVGIERVDFLALLIDVKHINEKILSMLSDKDLHSASKVSTIWQRIIKDSIVDSARLANYIRNQIDGKENIHDALKTSTIKRSTQARGILKKINTICDYDLHSNSLRSPSASPSKARFQENLKVNKTIHYSINNN